MIVCLVSYTAERADRANMDGLARKETNSERCLFCICKVNTKRTSNKQRKHKIHFNKFIPNVNLPELNGIIVQQLQCWLAWLCRRIGSRNERSCVGWVVAVPQCQPALCRWSHVEVFWGPTSWRLWQPLILYFYPGQNTMAVPGWRYHFPDASCVRAPCAHFTEKKKFREKSETTSRLPFVCPLTFGASLARHAGHAGHAPLVGECMTSRGRFQGPCCGLFLANWRMVLKTVFGRKKNVAVE